MTNLILSERGKFGLQILVLFVSTYIYVTSLRDSLTLHYLVS